MDQFWFLIDSIRYELLLFSAIWFLIGALDELLVDLLWLRHKLSRWLRHYRRNPPLRATELAAPQQTGLIAIFVPAWNEAMVITEMLQRCELAWRDQPTRYRLYVGCYSNDPDGIAAALQGAAHNPNCRIILNQSHGPTTKADCLNRLWHALIADELSSGFKAKAVLLHDAEDFVHRDELRIFDLLIEKARVVQLPVIPTEVNGSRWISGHYGDEFAEAHGKTLVVREAIGAALPLAGVGCAIERNHLGRIALGKGGAPFDRDSLTEDYELGLASHCDGQRAIFARIWDDEGRLVGTRACFPATLSASVRQKSRWMIGIALAGWDRLGWRGGVAEYWMRLRDRKAVFAAIVLSVAYVCIGLTAFLLLAERAGLYTPAPIGPLAVALIAINTLFLAWRLVVRAFFVARAQGWQSALFSVPRTLIANIVAIMASRRAVVAYARHLGGKALHWDKTTHAHFPVFGGTRSP